jgi:hypothetical protein
MTVKTTVKIRRREYLVAIAIVTSAGVLQIREHMQVTGTPVASARAASSCGVAHDGLVPASCEPTRGERTQEPQRNATRIWV